MNRGILFLSLAIAIVASDSIIFFADVKSRPFYSNSIIVANASIAVALALIIAYREKLEGPHGKAHGALAIGLSLWISADIVWAFYELVLEIAPPVPSPADLLWFVGYGFLAYNLFSMYKELLKKVGRAALAVTITGNVLFLVYIIFLTFGLSEFSSPRGVAMFAIMASYPILDAVLIIPAVLILWALRHEQRHSVPWICESTSLLCIAVSDSWFAFIFLTHLVDQLWLDSVFFAAEYLLMAAGLFWYVKFVFPHHNKDWAGTLSAPSSGGTITLATSPAIGFPLGKKGSGIAAVAIALVAIILVTALVIFPSYSPLSFSSSSSRIIPDSAQAPAPIIIGAILPMTGVWSSFGEAGYAALEMAVEDVNVNFSKTNGKTVKVIVEDFETDPIIALEKLKKLDSIGVKIVIGPSTSAELDVVRQYADENGILLISSSMAPSLAIRGDNAFRFVSDDVYQAEAVAKQMWNGGVRVVVPMWRSDSWGNDLTKFMRDNFEKLGGRVVDGVGYAPLTGESSASLSRINLIIWNQQLKALSSKVSQAIAQYGADKVGVHIAAFDEAVPILIQAQTHPYLDEVKWYGSDGSAQLKGLLRNHDAAHFAIETHFLNPIWGVSEENAKFEQFQARIEEKIHRIPRSYAAVTYDSLWVAALTLNRAGQTSDVNSLKSTFLQEVDSYVGVTGKITLNNAGDRINGDYDFWAIAPNDSGDYQWELVAKFHID